MKKKLIIISSESDTQAFKWYEICLLSKIPTLFLDIYAFEKDWHLELTKDSCVITHNSCNYELNDKQICWYIRPPMIDDKRIMNVVTLLYELFFLHAYDLGNFFLKNFDFSSLESSKPYELSCLRFSKSPKTEIKNFNNIKENQLSDYIVKSISNIRSIVVDLSDKRLKNKFYDQKKSIFMTQSKVTGTSLKVHCYKRKNNQWEFFSIITPSNAIDYRYDTQSTFIEISTPMLCQQHAEQIFQLVGAKFFDLDYILESDGMLWFLEVNFGPVPKYYEVNLSKKIHFYSARILEDWLL